MEFPGDIIRARNIRIYMSEPRNWAEFVVDQEKVLSRKKAFVLLYLGDEPLQLVDKNGQQVAKPLDVNKALNDIGWYSEQQLLAAGVSEEVIKGLQNGRDA